jgi:hypothetical protein
VGEPLIVLESRGRRRRRVIAKGVGTDAFIHDWMTQETRFSPNSGHGKVPIFSSRANPDSPRAMAAWETSSPPPDLAVAEVAIILRQAAPGTEVLAKPQGMLAALRHDRTL